MHCISIFQLKTLGPYIDTFNVLIKLFFFFKFNYQQNNIDSH